MTRYRIVEKKKANCSRFYIEYNKGIFTLWCWITIKKFVFDSNEDLLKWYEKVEFATFKGADNYLRDLNPEIIYYNYTEEKNILKKKESMEKEKKEIEELISYDPLLNIQKKA